MILETFVDWDDPKHPMIGIHGEKLPRRRPTHTSDVFAGDEYEPSEALDLFLSYLDDTDSVVREHEEAEHDYRVTLHKVKGDYRRALRIETHCTDRVWFYRSAREAEAAYALAVRK